MEFHQEVSRAERATFQRLHLPQNFINDIETGPEYIGWTIYFDGFMSLTEVQLGEDRRQLDAGTLDVPTRVLRRTTGKPSLRVYWSPT